MKIAIIGDIHGNIYALESVLEDIKKKKVDLILSTGDLVGYLPYPNEVVELLRKERVISVKGNHDERVVLAPLVEKERINNMAEKELHAKASLVFTSTELTEENKAYLRSLPRQLHFEFDQKKMSVVHGSPRRIDEYLYEADIDVHESIQAFTGDLLICGHTHIPYHKEIDGKHILNPGSVGKPKDGSPDAKYMILELSAGNIYSEMISITYDLNKIIEVVESSKFFPEKVINQLQQKK